MSLYEMINEDFSDDVDWLLEKLVKKILDEGVVPESYDLISQFISGGRFVGRDFENAFTQVAYRIKSALPMATTRKILGNLMREIVERESVWAEGWARYYENVNAKKKYEETTQSFEEYIEELKAS